VSLHNDTGSAGPAGPLGLNFDTADLPLAGPWRAFCPLNRAALGRPGAGRRRPCQRQAQAELETHCAKVSQYSHIDIAVSVGTL